MSSPSSPTGLRHSSPISILELLHLILSFLDDASVARTVPVCRHWAEVALDVVWHDVRDVRRLLSLLAPLSSEKHTGPLIYQGVNFVGSFIVCWEWLLRTIPDPQANWNRFNRYAPHVRRLCYDERSRKCIDPSVWIKIAATRPPIDLLPNLQELKWHATHPDRQQFSILFLHPHVRRISLHIHRFPSAAQYVQSVLERVTNIFELEIQSTAAMREIEPDVLPLIQNPSLRCVMAPMYFLTSSIFTHLSRLPNLQAIKLNEPVEKGVGDPMDVAHFSPSLGEGAFPTLRRLSFSANLPDATSFVQGSFSPRNISFFHLHIIAVDDPRIVRNFFEAVSTSCQLITELHVDFVIGPDAHIIYPPPPLVDRPSIETFRPLFSCRRLTRFDFRWDYQLNLAQADIEEIASSWPALEVLLLNCQPITELTPPNLTLSALVPFAQHCPNLTELGLYLDARDPPAPVGTDTTPTYPIANTSSGVGTPAFRCLERLFIGASSISIVEPVALFLSQLCPLGCEIISGVRWPDAYGIALDTLGIMDQRRVQMAEWYVKWLEVSKVLPLATKARMEEKKRMDTLRKEMDTLVTRSRTEKDIIYQLKLELEELRSRARAAG